MLQTSYRDLKGRNNPDDHWHRDHRHSTPNPPLHGESNFSDSSGPLFSIYSNAAEDEDKKMVEGWREDAANGILIFAGLFSAVVASLLSVSVMDLKPNSQDTSAFYLGNIYGVLADPNASRASTPSPVAKPPPFSPPRYAIWVNSLWFLSLVMSLSCALLATSLHQWARRYIRLSQPARCSLEKRARMRAFFSNGVDKIHILGVVEGLPSLLHLSLSLFFIGLVIFLFNVNQEVFTCVFGWIGFFSIVYGLITLLPLIRQDSPYYTPLSMPAWLLFTGIPYVTFKVLASISLGSYGGHRTRRRLRDRYRGWMSGGVEKAAEEMASEQSSEIDVRILGWTISALGDDDSLERFFEAIPGFFNSKLVKNLENNFPETLLKTFWHALDGFMGRTLSSDSVAELVKSRRVIICRDIMSMIPCLTIYMHDNLRPHLDRAPVSIERLQSMARWFTHMSRDVSYTARNRAAKNLTRIQERDGRWIALASDVYGLSRRDVRYNVALGGDNVLLATLIDVSRRAIHSQEFRLVGALTQFDIHYTLPGLQHDFCTLWNEIVQEARNQGSYSIPVRILREIRHLYIALHQDTDAAPTAFSPSTDFSNRILLRPLSYPFCNIASHLPDSTAHIPVPLLTQPGDSPNASPHHSASGSNTVLRQVQGTSFIVEPPSPFDSRTPSSEIGDSPQAPAFPAHSCLPPTDAPPPCVIPAALQDVTSTATLSHPLEATTLRDIVAPGAKPDSRENLSAASTLTLASMPSSAPPVLHRPYAGTTSTLNLFLPTSSNIGFPIHALSHPCAHGLLNTGSMSFVNAVLQLLVRSPPFWNLFRELGDLKGQRGAGDLETGGGATPLIDAMVRFWGEFATKEKDPLPMQQSLRYTARGEPKEDEEAKKGHGTVDSFEPTYMYDAMKQNSQLKPLLDGKHQDAGEFLGLYLDALEEELVEQQTCISTHKPASAPSIEELEGETQSAEGEAEVEKRDYTAGSVKSSVSRIFGGKSRLTVRAPNLPDTVTIEDWRSLRLYVQPDSVRTIQDALLYVSRPQPVKVGQSGLSEVSQQVQIEALPPILVLHLERFLYDAAADGTRKINKHVQFAPELEITSEIMTPVPGKSTEPALYKLCGVLYHHGESAGSGHYTVDVLHPNGHGDSEESWLHIDDEAVSALRHEDVFEGQDTERVDGRCVYMLFYYRVASVRT